MKGESTPCFRRAVRDVHAPRPLACACASTPVPRVTARVPRPAAVGRVARTGRSARPPRPALVALGDLILDVVVASAQDLQTGTDVPGTLRFRAGGSAANVARSFAHLGGQAGFIGSVGRATAGVGAWARCCATRA